MRTGHSLVGWDEWGRPYVFMNIAMSDLPEDTATTALGEWTCFNNPTIFPVLELSWSHCKGMCAIRIRQFHHQGSLDGPLQLAETWNSCCSLPTTLTAVLCQRSSRRGIGLLIKGMNTGESESTPFPSEKRAGTAPLPSSEEDFDYTVRMEVESSRCSESSETSAGPPALEVMPLMTTKPCPLNSDGKRPIEGQPAWAEVGYAGIHVDMHDAQKEPLRQWKR